MSKPDNISQAIWDEAIAVTQDFKYDDAVSNHAEMKELGEAAWWDVEVIALALSQAYSRGLEDAARVADTGVPIGDHSDGGIKMFSCVHSSIAAAIRALGSK